MTMTEITAATARAAEQRSGPPDVSVVIYADRHLENAAQMYAYAANLLREEGQTFEFIFVDDSGDPRILAEIEGFQSFVKSVKVVRLPRSMGPGTAMPAGFRHARGRLILTLGPFLQVQPREIHKMFRKIDEGFDFVNGQRVRRTDSRLNVLQSRAYNWLIRRISGVELNDSNCTLKLFRRSLMDELVVYGDLYRFLPVLAARQGFLVCEVPVTQRRELNRTGFYSLGTYLRRSLDLMTLFFIGRFIARPLRFFGQWGGTLFLLGLAINLYLTALRLFADRGLKDRPLLLLGVVLIVVGVQIVSVGFVAELITFTHAKKIKDYHVEKVLE